MRTEGLQEVLLKVNENPDNQDRIAKMREIIKAVCFIFVYCIILISQGSVRKQKLTCFFFFLTQLTEWKAQPAPNPLASAFVRIFGQEIAFASIDKELMDYIADVKCRLQLYTKAFFIILMKLGFS